MPASRKSPRLQLGLALILILILLLTSLKSTLVRAYQVQSPEAASLSNQANDLLTVKIFPSKDNTLYGSTTGALSNGQGDYLFAGKTSQPAEPDFLRRAVLAFDLTSHIPATAQIVTATLTLHMSKTISGDQTVTLHRLSADWGESSSNAPDEEGTGAPAAMNDATWLHTFSNSSLWTNPGGDYIPTPSASTTVGVVGFYTWGSTSELVNDMQSWLEQPSTNFGWILIGDEDIAGSAKRFDSRENPTMNFRPVLTITFPGYSIYLPTILK